ncbi:MAG TPA: hypothetical protein VK699_08710 [Terriglobales bacterium]|jgi:hypothetical protein|nr:hypothetical protein [Terriglobales bacterium]
MELTLNLVWLVLSLAAGVAWVLGYRSSPDKCRLGQGLLLLFCVSIILFPVISLTDDIHEAAAYTEDRVQDAVRKNVRPAVSPQQSLLLFICACFALSFEAPRPRREFSLLRAASPLFRNIRFAPAVQKRPPPVLSVSL